MEFKKYSQIVELNGKPLEVEIKIVVEEDDYPIKGSFDFGDEEENKKYLARFERGDLFNGLIIVKASALGVTEQDSLGGCHIRSNNMFNSTPFENDVQSIVDDHGMVENAIDQLKTSALDQANKLKGFVS